MNTTVNIFNSNIYKSDISNEDMPTLLKQYYLIVNEYYNFLIENVKILDNNDYFYFIFNRGLNTLKYILNILLIYTKNIQLIVYHLKKAYLYYVEFVGQIGHDNHAYLQLNSRDAAIFVYKKTIYEINNDHKKNYVMSEKDSEKYTEFYKVIDVINLLIYTKVKKDKIVDKDNFILKLKILSKIINKLKDNYNNINIDYFIKLVEKLCYFYNDNRIDVLEIINVFINKLIKNKVSEKFLVNLNDINNIKQIKKLSSVKYINWLIKF